MISQQILLKNSEYIAQRYYYHYRNLFAQKALDLCDVQQEAKMIVLEILSKYPSKKLEDLKKLCNQAIGWKLNIILRDVIKEPEICSFEEEECSSYMSSYIKSNIFFKILEQFLTEEEYDILEMKFKNNMLDEEIGEEIGVSKQRVGQILKKIYVILSKKMKNLYLRSIM